MQTEAAQPKPEQLQDGEVPNQGTLRQLHSLIEESLQLYELEDQKTKIIDNLYNSLKVVTEFLSFSVQVHPETMNMSSDAQIDLLPNLDVVIKHPNKKAEVKRFNEYSTEVIAKVIEYVIPQIVELISVEKNELTKKITFLRSATQQLNQLEKIKENMPSFETVSEEDVL